MMEKSIASKELKKVKRKSLRDIGLDDVNIKHNEVIYIHIDEISDIDFEEAPNKEFITSIKRFGILTPIEVIKDNDGKYKVIDGRRRLIASKYLGLETIPAVIIETNKHDKEVLQIIGNVINIQRNENKNMLADSIFKLAEKGYSLYQIANLLGIKYSTVKDYLIFNRFPEKIKQAIIEGKIKPRIAKKLSELNSEELGKVIEILEEKGKFTRTDLKEIRGATVEKKSMPNIDISELFDDELDNIDNDSDIGYNISMVYKLLNNIGLKDKTIKKVLDIIEKELSKNTNKEVSENEKEH